MTITVSLLRGSSCPGCGCGDGGIEHQAGLHQDPIIQCLHCLARVFVGVDGFRRVIPEDKAPPVRLDFLTPRPFNPGLDGLNRQIADFEGIIAEHERKAAYWRRVVQGVKTKRLALYGLEENATHFLEGPVKGADDGQAVLEVASGGSNGATKGA